MYYCSKREVRDSRGEMLDQSKTKTQQGKISILIALCLMSKSSADSSLPALLFILAGPTAHVHLSLAEVMDIHCFYAWSSRLAQHAFLQQPELPVQGWHHPQWVGTSHINH